MADEKDVTALREKTKAYFKKLIDDGVYSVEEVIALLKKTQASTVCPACGGKLVDKGTTCSIPIITIRDCDEIGSDIHAMVKCCDKCNMLQFFKAG